MGWLTVNLKYSRGISQKRRLRKRDETSKRESCRKGKSRSVFTKKEYDKSYKELDNTLIKSKCKPIEKLSSDVLAKVFILSGNLNLPQVSFMLAQKLKRSRYLEISLLREQLDGSCLPIMPAMRWSFVNVDLLENLNVAEFSSNENSQTSVRIVDGGNSVMNTPFVPYFLQCDLEKYSSLISYMVCRGCRVENSYEVYEALAAKQDWKAVEALASREHRSTVETVVMALNAGRGAELAIELLKLTPNVNFNWRSMWNIQQAAICASVPEVSNYLNVG